LTLQKGINPNRTKIARFAQEKWGPGTKAGKKDAKSWRGNRKRKREDEDNGNDERNEKRAMGTDERIGE
jgi:hypothetical protein